MDYVTKVADSGAVLRDSEDFMLVFYSPLWLNNVLKCDVRKVVFNEEKKKKKKPRNLARFAEFPRDWPIFAEIGPPKYHAISREIGRFSVPISVSPVTEIGRYLGVSRVLELWY